MSPEQAANFLFPPRITRIRVRGDPLHLRRSAGHWIFVMIEILPALPVEQKPIDPRDRIIDLVAMKRYGEWLATEGTQEQYEAHHFGGLSFEERHDIAVAWATQQDHEFDAQRGDYYR